MNCRIKLAQRSQRCCNAKRRWLLGAACALLLGTAARYYRHRPGKNKTITAFPGRGAEVIMQKSHRYLFDQAVLTTGVKMIEIEGNEEMEKAIQQ